MCVLLFSLRHQRTLRVRLQLLSVVGKSHLKRPLHAPGEARQSRRPEGGVLIPRQTPDPGRSVPGFISDSALSSIQSLVIRRDYPEHPRWADLCSWVIEEGSIATPCLAAKHLVMVTHALRL